MKYILRHEGYGHWVAYSKKGNVLAVADNKSQIKNWAKNKGHTVIKRKAPKHRTRSTGFSFKMPSRPFGMRF